MLHTENRQCGKKSFHSITTTVIFIFLCMLSGCNGNRSIFDDSPQPLLHHFSESNLAACLSECAQADRDTIAGDAMLRKLYAKGSHCHWVNEYGVSPSADTLISIISEAKDYGLSPNAFLIDSLRNSINRINNRLFSANEDTLKTLAKIEYTLSKSYLRYVTGTRFGFFNPNRVLNKLDFDRDPKNWSKKRYKRLFDIKTSKADSLFCTEALSKISSADNLRGYLRALHPQSKLYSQLKTMLADTTLTEADRIKVLCNMERCRWQDTYPADSSTKYVAVNIPAFHLYAHDKDTLLDMRIGCGTFKNKTPLLKGNINRIDVNPVWIIPKSIIEKEVSYHAGDTAYFLRNMYSIIEKETGDTIPPETLDANMLKSGNYRIVQKSGPGNSLGRLVFRFPNNQSIYLHDTSSPAFFKREKRAVSHGCVRIQKPFDFACYLLSSPDEWLLDKIRISIDIKPETERGKKFMKDNEEADEKTFRLVRSIDVNPNIPVYLLYFTIFPNQDGVITKYNDVYGYDKIMWQYIKPIHR